jgi:hypothetical protein
MKLARITLYAAFPEDTDESHISNACDELAEQLRTSEALTVYSDLDHAGSELDDDADSDAIEDALREEWPTLITDGGAQ